MATYIIVIKSLLLGELRSEQASSQGPACREGGWPAGREAGQKGLSLSAAS